MHYSKMSVLELVDGTWSWASSLRDWAGILIGNTDRRGT
jgi:hypothetical protein